NARTLANRHIERVEIGMGAQKFERISGDAAHEIAMKRGHKFEPLALGIADRLLPRFLEIAAVFDQPRAERAHGGVLLHRIAARDINDRLDPGAPRRQREALAMI